MFSLSPMQNAWVIIALAAGVVFVLGVSLAYMMMWRPREGEVAAEEARPSWRATWDAIPWFLVLFFVATGVFGLLYTINKIVYPPNW